MGFFFYNAIFLISVSTEIINSTEMTLANASVLTLHFKMG